MGNKFAVGSIGNKNKKFVEAAKGTNLYFAIYNDKKGNRTYETIPLNVVVENQKQGALNNEKPEECSVPKVDHKGNELLFSLTPNDLVYIPTMEEVNNPHLFNCFDLTKEQNERIYKFVSSSGSQAFFIQHVVATSIVNKVEYSALNKMEKSIDEIMIKSVCWKLQVNRIGRISNIFVSRNK